MLPITTSLLVLVFWFLEILINFFSLALVNNLNEINCKVFDDFFSHNFIAKVSEVEDFYFAIVEEKRDLISV